MMLAIDLYLSICRPFLAVDLHRSVTVAFWTNFYPWSFALFWAVCPLAGWSSYELEKGNLRCAINWAGSTSLDMSYIAFLMVFCYVIPLTVMSICFGLVKRELHRMRERVSNMTSVESGPALENIRAEKKHVKLAFVMTSSFIVSWTPYCIISFISTYFKSDIHISAAVSTSAAVLAKMSTMLNPIIYSFLYSRFRQNIAIPCFGRLYQRNAVHSSAPPSAGSHKPPSRPSTMHSTADQAESCV